MTRTHAASASMSAAPCARSSRASHRTRNESGSVERSASAAVGTSMNASTSHASSSDSRMPAIAGAAVSSPASSSRRDAPGCQSIPMRECALRSSGPTMTSSLPGRRGLGPRPGGTGVVVHDEVDGHGARPSGRRARTV